METLSCEMENLKLMEEKLKSTDNERELKKTLRNLIAIKSPYNMHDTLIKVLNGDHTVDIISNAALALCLSNDVDFLKKLFNDNGRLSKTGKTAVALGIITGSDDMLFEIGSFLLSTDVGTHEKQTLLIARALEKLSKKLIKIENGMILAKDMEFFIFSNLSSHLDAVKNLSRNILQNVAVYYHQVDRPKFEILVGNIMEKPDHLKWISLLCIARCQLDFEVDNHFATSLLSLSGIFRHSATEIYATLMDRKMNMEDFETIWIKPLFSKQNVVESNYKMKNDIMSRLVDSKQLVLEYKKKHHDETGNLTHGDKQLRLECFQNLTLSQKTSQVFNDFSQFKEILKYNALNQCPAFRQSFFSIFKKFARRINDSYNLLKRNRQDVGYYEEFIDWLYIFLLNGLSVGSSFARRCFSLNCLVEVVRYFKKDLNGLDYVHWIYDTYEVNKAMAVILLSGFKFDDCEGLKLEAMRLIESVRPPDSVTGKYLLNLLININKLDRKTVVVEVFDKLRNNYKGMGDLMQISCEKPFYGYLSALKSVIENPDATLIGDVVKFCFELNFTLFPILGHSAPEGFLMDFENETPRSLKAQKLLVCCWRSMKEATLLLSDLVVKNLEKMEFSVINSIGEHLLYLLQNLMHRGVFEQVFVGFRLMAESLIKSHNDQLKNLPNVWLEKSMSEDVLCSKTVTRRSGGVPFIFQALLSGFNIADWVPRIVKQTQNEQKIAIHAMNILRSLFRDANFSNHVMPFVPEGLQVAFYALNSSDWTMRNSGLMLFGAILRRTFGPKLNLMSSDMFFKRFPTMREYLLKELQKITEDLTRFSTFHVLLLISCFNNEKGSDMSDYTALIRKCAASKDSQVRLVAARALVPIVAKKGEFVEQNYEIIFENQLSNNYIHGLLLQCLQLTNQISAKLAPLIDKTKPPHHEVLYEIIRKTKDRENFCKLKEKTIFDHSPGSYNLKVKYARAKLLFENDFFSSERIIFFEFLNDVVTNSVPVDVQLVKKRYLSEKFRTGDELELLYLKFFLENSVFSEDLEKRLEKIVFGRVCICFPYAMKLFNRNCFSITSIEKFAHVMVKNLEGDEDVRMSIADSLPLVKDLSRFKCDGVRSLFWLAILTLSQDDELSIRQVIIEKNYGSVCDSRGTELMMSNFCEMIKQYPLHGLLVLFGLLLKDNFLFGFGEDDEDEKLFEKSEMNMYFESVHLCKSFLHNFKLTLNVDEKIDSEVGRLFNTASGVENFKFNSIRDIIENFPCGNKESVVVLQLLRDTFLES